MISNLQLIKCKKKYLRLAKSQGVEIDKQVENILK